MSDKRRVFVFGSNRQGRHGKGAALEAKLKHGAIYGQAEGLQGNSYAIITKDIRQGLAHRKVKLEEIATSVDRFVEFAIQHPDIEFDVSPIGCGLAGFTPEQIAPLFIGAPSNVHLPLEFILHVSV